MITTTELPTNNFIVLLIPKHFQQEISDAMKVILSFKKNALRVFYEQQFRNASRVET
jgi:hypothetical protein